MEPLPRQEPDFITGYRAPEDQVADKVMIDMHPEIIQYLSAAHPVTTITGAVRKTKTATQYRFDWMEKDEMPDEIQITSSATSTGTTLTVDSSAEAYKYAVLINTRTRETIACTATPPSTTSLTVVRGVGSTKAAMQVGDKLLVMGGIFPDASRGGDLKSIKEYAMYNYTEILLTEFGFSGRDLNTRMYGGNDQYNEIQWQGIEHAKRIEKRWLFGTRHTTTDATTGKLRTYSGGLEYYIKTNVWDVNGIAPSERQFVEWMEHVMVHGKGGNREGTATKYFYAGRRWLTEIEAWARDKLEYVPEMTTIGIKAKRFQTTHGDIVLVPHPLLIGEHAGYAFLADMNHLRYVHHQGRNTKLVRNREENDLDGKKMAYFTDCGYMVEEEFAHAVVKGLPV